MSVLLIQSCSESKQRQKAPLPARELYTGYFYKIINKSRREGCLRDDIVLRILSAEHGILRPDSLVNYYDRRMTPERATELNPSVVNPVVNTIEKEEINRVIVNVGSDYRPALAGLKSLIPDNIELTFVNGAGIGEKGQQLKSIIRTDEQTVMTG